MEGIVLLVVIWLLGWVLGLAGFFQARKARREVQELRQALAAAQFAIPPLADQPIPGQPMPSPWQAWPSRSAMARSAVSRMARLPATGWLRSGCARCSGSSNQKVLPTPTVLSTPISPPISSTSRRQMARPSPVPP